MYSGINITYECCVIQSILYEVSNAISDDVFKRKCLFNGELMLHSTFKKDAEKVLYVTKLEEKGLIKINEKFRTEKSLCTFLLSNIFIEGQEISITKITVLIWNMKDSF